MAGSRPRPKGTHPQKIPILFPISALPLDCFSMFSVPSHNSLNTTCCYRLCRPAKYDSRSEFHQQRNIFTLIYSTLQTFGKNINVPCTYQALHTAQAWCRESHQHSSEHKRLTTQPKGKMEFHSFSKHCRRIPGNIPLSNTFFQQCNKHQTCQS